MSDKGALGSSCSRAAVTAFAIGNASSPPLSPGEGRGDGAGNDQPRSHDTSRIAWAKLLACIGEQFRLECPECGGDIRLIAFITDPTPIRKILEAIGEPLEPPPLAFTRGRAGVDGPQVEARRRAFREKVGQMGVSGRSS